jgi:hypothetical protein
MPLLTGRLVGAEEEERRTRITMKTNLQAWTVGFLRLRDLERSISNLTSVSCALVDRCLRVVQQLDRYQCREVFPRCLETRLPWRIGPILAFGQCRAMER